MNALKAARIACVWFLVVGLLLSMSFLLFAIGMEGMRHSHPGPSQFDRYYWIPALPVGLSAYWLAAVFLRLSRKFTQALTLAAAALSLWWLALAYDEGAEVSVFAAVFVGLSFLASWYAKVHSREHRQSQNA